MPAKYRFTQTGPSGLPDTSLFRTFGPTVEIVVSLTPSAVAILLMQPDAAVPAPITGVAVIDTGAGITCVDGHIADRLGLTPSEMVTVSTPLGPAERPTYRPMIELPDIKLTARPERVARIDLSGAVVVHHGRQQPIIALIGRDILERCVFTYDGPGATFSISA